MSEQAKKYKQYLRTEAGTAICAMGLAERMDTELGFTSLVEFTPHVIIITDVTKDNCNELCGRYACEGKGVLNQEDNILDKDFRYASLELFRAMKAVSDESASFVIGGWKDITGYYIGNTLLTNSKQNAERYCKQEGEIAFWDIQESKECKVPHRGTLSDMAVIIRNGGVQKVEAFLNASIDAGDARPIEDFKAYAPQSCGTETQRRTVRQLFIREVVEAAKAEMY